MSRIPKTTGSYDFKVNTYYNLLEKGQILIHICGYAKRTWMHREWRTSKRSKNGWQSEHCASCGTVLRKGARSVCDWLTSLKSTPTTLVPSSTPAANSKKREGRLNSLTGRWCARLQIGHLRFHFGRNRMLHGGLDWVWWHSGGESKPHSAVFPRAQLRCATSTAYGRTHSVTVGCYSLLYIDPTLVRPTSRRGLQDARLQTCGTWKIPQSTREQVHNKL